MKLTYEINVFALLIGLVAFLGVAKLNEIDKKLDKVNQLENRIVRVETKLFGWVSNNKIIIQITDLIPSTKTETSITIKDALLKNQTPINLQNFYPKQYMLNPYQKDEDEKS